jgi:16S rRNA (cytidine1402-2'-O)-methyltransferase
LCEDTRTSLVLLNHYDIKKPLFSYHKFNEKSEVEKIVKDLLNGKNIALISDAGMPGISDPGNILVNECINSNIEYTVISGPSALINAFVMSGMQTPFTFIGFLPNKKSDAKKILDEYSKYKSTLIFYVAPHDLNETIKVIYSVLGDRNAVAVREISKKFEAKVFFNLEDGYPGLVKGEFVLVVEGCNKKEESNLTVVEELNKLIDGGLDKNSAIKQVAHTRGLKKNAVYQEYLNMNKK